MIHLRRAFAIALLLACPAAFAFFIPSEAFVAEFVNEITGHYVLLTGNELTAVQNGSAGPGWAQTGHNFHEPDPVFTRGLIPVCRFYSPVNNSHFFTANPAECESLKNPSSGWIYEKIAFQVVSRGPDCTGFGVPIFRLYNNRHAFHDANHRFTADAATRDQMIAAGWIDEGVAWCATRGGVDPVKTFAVVTALAADPAQCESRPGACLRVAQLPALSNLVPSFFPPFFVNRNPEFPTAVTGVTGVANVDIHTAQPSSDAAAILRHSFVQAYATGSGNFGIHVNGADRIGTAYASIDPMYELPGAAPAAGGTDERLFPWRGVKHHTLVATFALAVPTIARDDASSHAYGNLVLQFADTKSGHSFYATVQAYGTQTPADFAAPDAFTGIAIASTSFREAPAFGARLSGDFKACAGATACIDAPTAYTFRMIDADMAKAIQVARTVDAALSTDPADYFVAQFRVHNETYGNAELGASVLEAGLHVYY